MFTCRAGKGKQRCGPHAGDHLPATIDFKQESVIEATVYAIVSFVGLHLVITAIVLMLAHSAAGDKAQGRGGLLK